MDLRILYVELVFTPLTNQNVKLIVYSASAVNVISSNPCVGPLPTIKIFHSVVSMHRRTTINTKYYCIFTKFTII